MGNERIYIVLMSPLMALWWNGRVLPILPFCHCLMSRDPALCPLLVFVVRRSSVAVPVLARPSSPGCRRGRPEGQLVTHSRISSSLSFEDAR